MKLFDINKYLNENIISDFKNILENNSNELFFNSNFEVVGNLLGVYTYRKYLCKYKNVYLILHDEGNCNWTFVESLNNFILDKYRHYTSYNVNSNIYMNEKVDFSIEQDIGENIYQYKNLDIKLQLEELKKKVNYKFKFNKDLKIIDYLDDISCYIIKYKSIYCLVKKEIDGYMVSHCLNLMVDY